MVEDEYLQQQLTSDVARYKPSNKRFSFDVITTSSLSSYIENNNKQVFFIDEADYALDKHLFRYQQNTVHGLVLLQKKHAFLFSATFSSYWEDLVSSFFSAKNGAIQRHASKLEAIMAMISIKDEYHLTKSKETLMNECLSHTRKFYERNNPVIVFIDISDHDTYMNVAQDFVS